MPINSSATTSLTITEDPMSTTESPNHRLPNSSHLITDQGISPHRFPVNTGPRDLFNGSLPYYDVGEIREYCHDEKTPSFQWRIPSYLLMWNGISLSPAVNIFSRVWNLGILIKSACTVDDEVYLFREGSTSEIQESVRFTIVYRKQRGREKYIVRGERFPATSNRWGPGCPRWDVLNKDLTITCTVWKDGPTHSEGVSCEKQTEDASSINGRDDEYHLKGHFENLLVSGDLHDVLIKVGDRQFRAHKCVLACSPVFAAMFRSEMKESADHTVTIEDCDPEAFGKFLQYVYTGHVDITSTGNALQVYYVADKYDFPRLKEICVRLLKTSLTVTAIADVISLAARHNEEELMQAGIVYFSEHLEEVMVTVEWQRFLTANPIQANEMCLKAVQCHSERCKQVFSLRGIRGDAV